MRLLLPLLALFLTAASPLPPGSAFAWVTFDARGETGGAVGGLADRAAGRAVTVADPVRIASVSKLLVALGVLRLVEQGRLDLDRDVSDWLGTRVRNPAFPERPITLRLLLSHRSSLTDDADYVIPLGRDLRTHLADPKAWDAAHPPGAYFRYANLNFPVIGSVMEAATGERLDRLLARLVLEPLGLDACFNWTTCSPAAVARAVVLYQPDGSVLRDDLKGALPACPVVPAADGGCDLSAYVPGTNGALFSPQGGLRISARDLAAVGRLLLNDGRHGDRRFLSPASMKLLTDGAWRFDGTNGQTDAGFYCGYGLATQILPSPQAGCRDDLTGTGAKLIGHAGDAYGVRSGLWIDPKRKVGIAYFATGLGEQQAPGRSAYRAAEEWLAGHLERPR